MGDIRNHCLVSNFDIARFVIFSTFAGFCEWLFHNLVLFFLGFSFFICFSSGGSCSTNTNYRLAEYEIPYIIIEAKGLIRLRSNWVDSFIEKDTQIHQRRMVISYLSWVFKFWVLVEWRYHGWLTNHDIAISGQKRNGGRDFHVNIKSMDPPPLFWRDFSRKKPQY